MRSSRRHVRLSNWRRQKAVKANTAKLDAEAKMFKGTPMEGVSFDPIRDPLWLTPEQAEERKSVMEQVAAYEGATMPAGFHDHAVTLRGQTHSASDFTEWQHRRAYDLLAAGADVRQVAVEVFREPAWVAAVKSKFDL